MNRWLLGVLVVLLVMANLSRFGATAEGFAAIRQVVSDPIMFHLIGT